MEPQLFLVFRKVPLFAYLSDLMGITCNVLL